MVRTAVHIRSAVRRIGRAVRVPSNVHVDHSVPHRLPLPDDQPAVASMLDADERRIISEVRTLTMVSPERLIAIIDAVKYIVARGIPGGLAECGVWRGGSVLTMIKTLQLLGVDDRSVYLFDTFEGMTEPGEEDTSPIEPPALDTWRETPSGQTPWPWAFDPTHYGIDQVRSVLEDSGYPRERLHLVPGPVEDTLPESAPHELALLRLDTDWYKSTKHELVHLYPRLSAGGVLIVDDVGHWEGARQAVEEYFAESASPILLNRTDYTGRLGVKY